MVEESASPRQVSLRRTAAHLSEAVTLCGSSSVRSSSTLGGPAELGIVVGLGQVDLPSGPAGKIAILHHTESRQAERAAFIPSVWNYWPINGLFACLQRIALV
jgi:hypothetical protein